MEINMSFCHFVVLSFYKNYVLQCFKKLWNVYLWDQTCQFNTVYKRKLVFGQSKICSLCKSLNQFPFASEASKFVSCPQLMNFWQRCMHAHIHKHTHTHTQTHTHTHTHTQICVTPSNKNVYVLVCGCLCLNVWVSVLTHTYKHTLFNTQSHHPL